MIIIKCNNLNDTDRLAKIVSDLLFNGFLILASGDLGAGKTRFAKGLAFNLGIKDTVTSPTFNILKCYEGEKYNFYHIDAYRLEGIKQDLGLEEFIEGDNVCVVEWSEYIDYLLPDEFLKMSITINDDESRNFVIEGNGDKYLIVEKEIERLW